MKLLRELSAVAAVNQIMAEASGPFPYETMMDVIITNQKSGADLDVTEVFTVANLVWFFNSGRTSTNADMVGPVNMDSNATTTEAGDAIRVLNAEQMGRLATELKAMVELGNAGSPVTAVTAGGMTTSEWIAYVLQRQD